ncbi:Oidioi.mRNA.OKI2018_I69.chr1.g2453.t2.cds [Oikopleura dioica]|uniref:Oidioi.mRNA.OKI2018_I69.chr1.g2453.t2.cds n=1 Tax=Oikopleura dioica TaxID=34765 RepID=A0ABN7SV24_OIKDI|nr:Oidioi.mRNA.OKI2018_I69.chr1.g2453.t2.cds [Oikopleura dioica]
MTENGGRFEFKKVAEPADADDKFEKVPLHQNDDDNNFNDNFALFEEEMEKRPTVSQFISTVQNYTNLTQTAADHEAKENGEDASSAKMGTLAGVYFPTIQNIFGVILFLRFAWIVGVAGVGQTFLLVLICCMTTMLTAFSMSAIATNGVVPAGGAYFMISRALGPEFGGAVGILFYLGTTFGSAMYILGGVEILIKYAFHDALIHFVDDEDMNLMHNYRLYGTIFLAGMSSLVFVGVKYVNKAAFFLLVIVLLSIMSIFVGLFKTLAVSPAGVDPDSSLCVDTCMCMLGDHLLHATEDSYCAKTFTDEEGVIHPTDYWKIYCTGDFNSTDTTFANCDQNFASYEMTRRVGFPGFRGGNFSSNFKSMYQHEDELLVDKHMPPTTFYVINESSPITANEDYPAWIVADATSSFTVLLGIFFPSVTGIMAGSNRSGDLKDAQDSIPKEPSPLLRQLQWFTFFAHSSGDGGKLVASVLVWPHPYFMVIGAFLSTIGAGLQSLTGAPRLLQAIAKDNVIPFLSFFAGGKANGEPTWALLLTALIAESGIIIAELDAVAPILTMFFLMCYMFVNLACVLQILLRTPSWRPRFRYYHWAASLSGMIMCIVLMFICSWVYALVALSLAALVYKYIEYKGAEKEWGDGMKGPPHTKNWRPQILTLVKLDSEYRISKDQLLDFVTQLKAGKGLVMVYSVVNGDFLVNFAESQAAENVLKRALKDHQIKGFSNVLIAQKVEEGLSALIQTAGLGGLRHNTVLCGWPAHWKQQAESGYRNFLAIVRAAAAGHHSLLVPKNIQLYPTKDDTIEGGTIDVWWIVHDGGLLTLLPHLLQQHRVWKNCRTRIYTVAQAEDNSIKMKKQLQQHLYQLRIEAEVRVVELESADVSAYAYERTLIMEQRNHLIHTLRENKKKSKIQAVQAVNGIHPQPAKPDVPMTWSAENGKPPPPEPKIEEVQNLSQMFDMKPDQPNLRRMHNAVRLNEVIVTESHDAKLVILNLPGPPKKNPSDVDGPNKERNYMEFLEVLTEGLDRVLMVRGGGREVVTIYN